MNTLSSRAMLVALNIRQWSARKYDKQATREVETAHTATNAGRFNKLLIDPLALRDINHVAGKLRALHYYYTLPWGDNGDRLLPADLYLEFQTKMNEMTQQFDAVVRTFLAGYPALVTAARTRLGTLYEPADYPGARELASRFGADLTFSLVPDTADFRVDVSAETAKKICADVLATTAQRQQAAMDSALERARDVITRVRDRVTADKVIIHDSLTESVAELIRVLPAFNLNNDPRVDEVVSALNTMTVSPHGLRRSASTRAQVAIVADDILKKMGWA